VHVNVTEGDKQRIHVFEGVVLRRRGGGRSETFTVRKLSYGVGVERIFPVESPAVKKVEIKARGHVRRSRLYYLRGLTGKKARLRSKLRDLSGLISQEEAEAQSGTADSVARATAPPAEAVEAEEPAVAEATSDTPSENEDDTKSD